MFYGGNSTSILALDLILPSTCVRERYEDLTRECQMMYSSVGTGQPAYVVGPKVMDVRTPSKDNDISEEETKGN